MTDLDRTFRAAIDDATRAAVTPPIAAIAHRAQVRHTRRVASVAAVAVLVVAGVAVAAPRVAAVRRETPAHGGGLKPFDSIGRDPQAMARYRTCRARLPEAVTVGSNTPIVSAEDMTACLKRLGYAPPPPGFPEPCLDDSAPTTVAEGDGSGRSWRYAVFPALDPGIVCDETFVDGRQQGGSASTGQGSLGIGEGVLYDAGGGGQWWLVHGVAPANAARLVVIVNGTRYDATPVAVPGVPDSRYYGVGVLVRADALTTEVVAYDAAGRVVSRSGVHRVDLRPVTGSPAPRATGDPTPSKVYVK